MSFIMSSTYITSASTESLAFLTIICDGAVKARSVQDESMTDNGDITKMT